MIDIDKLESLARAATPGYWRQGSVEKDRIFVEHKDGLGPERVLLRMNTHFECEADAAYIDAAQPANVLALIAEVRRLSVLVARRT